MKPPFLQWLLAVLAVWVSWDFVHAPFTNDVAIFMGVENIADKFYPFPQGIDLAWEAKPIGNRIINYILMKISSAFVPFSDMVNFAIVTKIVVLVILILVALYVARIIGGSYTFWIIFFAFTTCCNFCIMQSEWWAVLLSLLTLALLLSRWEYAPYLAGFLFIFVGMIKGITALLFIPVLCGAYMLGKVEQEAIAKVLGGVVATTLAVCLAQLTVWPNMLPDLLLAPAITGVGRVGIMDLLFTFTGQSITSMFYIPVIIVGMVAAALLIFSGYLSKTGMVISFCILWLSVMVMVFIHSEFFAYQFFVYVLPSLICIFLGLRRIDEIQ